MAKAVRKLLQAGLDKEKEALDQAKQKSEEEKKKKAAEKAEKAKATKKGSEESNVKDNENDTQKIVETSEEVNNKKSTSSKHPGGRPTLESLGKASRKQYTLTLKETDYKAFLERAGKEDLSFAKFMEKAAKEYMSKHKLN